MQFGHRVMKKKQYHGKKKQIKGFEYTYVITETHTLHLGFTFL